MAHLATLACAQFNYSIHCVDTDVISSHVGRVMAAPMGSLYCWRFSVFQSS